MPMVSQNITIDCAVTLYRQILVNIQPYLRQTKTCLCLSRLMTVHI